MDVWARIDEARFMTDDEAVWSWSPDAGIKLVDEFTGGGGKKSPVAGESAE
jgi:hypothetical protein